MIVDISQLEKIFRHLHPDILYYEENKNLQTARDRILNVYDVQGVSRVRTAIISTTKIIEKLEKNNF